MGGIEPWIWELAAPGKRDGVGGLGVQREGSRDVQTEHWVPGGRTVKREMESDWDNRAECRDGIYCW